MLLRHHLHCSNRHHTLSISTIASQKMISFHVAGACRRRMTIAFHSPLISSTSNSMPSDRNFASKRPPSHRQRKTKTSTDQGGKQNLQQDQPQSNRPREHGNKRFKKPRQKEWKRPVHPLKDSGPKVLQQSGLMYELRRRDGDDQSSSPKIAIASLDASALLDPLSYCKASAKVAETHGVSRSISGTDAARRLLRGKKEFITVARTMRSPGLLTGHGVPSELLQHCVDMADALMQDYGQNIVEISFHNYNDNLNSNETKHPHILRIRGQDGTNRCSQWPTLANIDWDYHMSLYVAVMERLVKNLGLVLPSNAEEESEERNHDDLTASPLLFPSSKHIPHWNVDILRGGVFQFYDGDDGMPNDDVAPTPIVEFSHVDNHSEALGHVLIRLQGKSLPNSAFTVGQSGRRVTLVFDACFR